ncbi:MAG: hypothetical protein PQJ61_16100 [Spirochaetales bacterium]|uniref:Uncharacterized protein n=1 Tax=Candidatus Thalassospirochaeta sargassi TaxID=3119039 RepID=A0AAJ1IJB0_9SPIO|nr:hypothetical protein [Spirochaetales bacterium]
MKIEQHGDISEKLFGERAEDIHEWIDQYFDHKKFRHPFWNCIIRGWNPYDHRAHLHHIEALPEALEAFRGKYSEEIITNVFTQHLKDDYGGYVPTKADFDSRSFARKYHRLF